MTDVKDSAEELKDSKIKIAELEEIVATKDRELKQLEERAHAAETACHRMKEAAAPTEKVIEQSRIDLDTYRKALQAESIKKQEFVSKYQAVLQAGENAAHKADVVIADLTNRIQRVRDLVADLVEKHVGNEDERKAFRERYRRGEVAGSTPAVPTTLPEIL